MTVYVVQNPTLHDPDSGNVWKKFDIRKAKEFGELHVMLHPYRLPDSYEEIAEQLRDHLEDAGECDYLLPSGEIVSSCIATAIFAEMTGGIVPLLKWDRESKSYYEYVLEMPQ